MILTDWAEFGRLKLDRLKSALRYPIVVDGRNLYEPWAMAEAGLTYLSVGRPATPSGAAGETSPLAMRAQA